MEILVGDPLALASHTTYSKGHVRNAGFGASDITFESGVVVVNEDGGVLLVEDVETGRIELPRSSTMLDEDSMLLFPGQYLREMTGLTVERLPLLKPARRYNNGNVQDWDLLETELHFADGARMTTGPFSIGLDLICIPEPDLPDTSQAMTAWYAGIVRNAPKDDQTRNGLRLCFVPIQDAIQIIQDPFCDFAGVRALRFFEVLWKATMHVSSRKD